MTESRPFNLLMVDDSAADIRLMLEAIRLSGLDTLALPHYSSTWPEAFHILESNYEKGVNFHLILLDLNLPKVDGREILNSIRQNERYARLPVIIVTNSDYGKDISDCFSLGAHAYLEKPSDFNQLIDFFVAVKRSLEFTQRACASEIQKNYNQLRTLQH